MQSNKTQVFLDALTQPSSPKTRFAGAVAIGGGDQTVPYRSTLNKALIEATIRMRTGQAVETSVCLRQARLSLWY
jgi:hypothetical protein